MEDVPADVLLARVVDIRRLLGLGAHACLIGEEPAPGTAAAEAGLYNIHLQTAFEILARFHAHGMLQHAGSSVSADELVAVFGGFPELAAPLDDEETMALSHTSYD